MTSHFKRRLPAATQNNLKSTDYDSKSDESGSDKDGDNKKKQTKKKKNAVELDSFTHDKDDKSLIVPTFALDADKEEEFDKIKAEGRINRFHKEYDKEIEAAKDIKKANLVQFDEQAALGFKDFEETIEDVWNESKEAAPAADDDLFGIDPKNGKSICTRDPIVKLEERWARRIPRDGTTIFAGIRRSGKSYGVRDFCYEFRHLYKGALIFSATKFNGWYSEHFPNYSIHEGSHSPLALLTITELDGDLIDEFMHRRGEQIIEYRRQFGKHAKDGQSWLIILDDCVDITTPYSGVRGWS